jgi:hypothetical protein
MKWIKGYTPTKTRKEEEDNKLELKRAATDFLVGIPHNDLGKK